MNDSHDFGYALRKEFWHKGIVTEASKSLVSLLKKRASPILQPRMMLKITAVEM